MDLEHFVCFTNEESATECALLAFMCRNGRKILTKKYFYLHTKILIDFD
jgi:hypothetical protein